MMSLSKKNYNVNILTGLIECSFDILILFSYFKSIRDKKSEIISEYFKYFNDNLNIEKAFELLYDTNSKIRVNQYYFDCNHEIRLIYKFLDYIKIVDEFIRIENYYKSVYIRKIKSEKSYKYQLYNFLYFLENNYNKSVILDMRTVGLNLEYKNKTYELLGGFDYAPITINFSGDLITDIQTYNDACKKLKKNDDNSI